jgi:hypothetical protein
MNYFLTGQFMFPNPKHTPAKFPQFEIHCFVAGFISSDFAIPILSVRCRTPITLEAAMPKAAVNKYDEFFA